MLQCYPTKNGTGVSIFGDYADLEALYHTIHHIASPLDEENRNQKAQNKLLMNFAYEVRKAYSGQRLINHFNHGNPDNEVEYYGFQVVWTDIIIFINALRYNAGYVDCNKLHQGFQYLIEYAVENALFAYDAEGANKIKDYLSGGINISSPYAFHIYQALHIEFVSRKSGKARFRSIPLLFNSFFAMFGRDQEELIASFKKSAQEQNCDPLDMEFKEFPDIKW